METKCGKSAESTTISCSEKPLEKTKSKAATKTFEEQSNLFPVYTRMVKLSKKNCLFHVVYYISVYVYI